MGTGWGWWEGCGLVALVACLVRAGTEGRRDMSGLVTATTLVAGLTCDATSATSLYGCGPGAGAVLSSPLLSVGSSGQ